MNGRFLFVCVALLAFAKATSADGTYQPTRDGRTIVWSNDPKPGDEATWWGGRDREGYARGFGILTWYTRQPGTGASKPVLYARYWGNMVRGKFEGPVNVHAKKKTDHALFVDGTRATRWSPGAAPSQYAPSQYAIIAKPTATAEPPVPAAGPASERPGLRQRPPDEVNLSQLPSSNSDLLRHQPQLDIDESIRIVILPPRSLRWRK